MNNRPATKTSPHPPAAPRPFNWHWRRVHGGAALNRPANEFTLMAFFLLIWGASGLTAGYHLVTDPAGTVELNRQLLKHAVTVLYSLGFLLFAPALLRGQRDARRWIIGLLLLGLCSQLLFLFAPLLVSTITLAASSLRLDNVHPFLPAAASRTLASLFNLLPILVMLGLISGSRARAHFRDYRTAGKGTAWLRLRAWVRQRVFVHASPSRVLIAALLFSWSGLWVSNALAGLWQLHRAAHWQFLSDPGAVILPLLVIGAAGLASSLALLMNVRRARPLAMLVVFAIMAYYLWSLAVTGYSAQQQSALQSSEQLFSFLERAYLVFLNLCECSVLLVFLEAERHPPAAVNPATAPTR